MAPPIQTLARFAEYVATRRTPRGRCSCIYFYRRYFGAPRGLALARAPYVLDDKIRAKCEVLFPGEDHERAFRTLKRLLAEMDCAVPTLYKQ